MNAHCDCYLIERSGPSRAIWGPYPESMARRIAGARHSVVRGSGLVDGSAMNPGAAQAAIQSGRIWLVSATEYANASA